MEDEPITPNLDSFEVFPWNANFETGIAIVDEQHKKLIDLLNKLTGTLVYGDTVEPTQVLDELAAYAIYHFETEEPIWVACFRDDPWLVSHQDTHTSFLPTVLKMREGQGDKPLRETIEHIVKFLIRWLAFHILDRDKRMAIVVHKVEAGTSFADAKKISEEEMSDSAQVLINTVLVMYEAISSRTLDLMRERIERQKVEEKLNQANRELEKLAITDQLTGLLNRRHFDEVFDRELRRAKREKRSLTFIMFDIDHFKKLNDHYGHVDGDVALKKVGQRLIELCRRPGDFAFRLGGEEFGVIVADQTSQPRCDFAEKIRAEIEALAIPNIESAVSDHMTVSVGIITKVPDSADTVDSYMRDVDDKLYQAKSQGRNQVVAEDL